MNGKRLFEDPSLAGMRWTHDVSADGRFVVIEDVVVAGDELRKPAIRVTMNWHEEFRDRE